MTRKNLLVVAASGPFLLTAVLAAEGGFFQRQVSNAPSRRSSPYAGTPVLQPEAASGVWDVPDGARGEVGIHLILSTTSRVDAVATTVTPELWGYLSVGVFQRHNTGPQLGDTNYFTDSSDTSAVRLTKGHLTLHFQSKRATMPSVDLDLEQRDGTWTGRVHRGEFDSVVTLRRPGAGITTTDPLAGTWEEHDSIPQPELSCVHIAQEGQNTFMGWSDSIYVPGRVLYPANTNRNATTSNIYGELMNASREGSDGISLELNAFSFVCCSRTFLGNFGANRDTVQGHWASGLNQFERPTSWTRMPGESCRKP